MNKIFSSKQPFSRTQLLVVLSTVVIIGFAVLEVSNAVIRNAGLSLDGERKPYIQMTTENSVIIRWITEQEGIAEVYFGTEPNQLFQLSINNTATRHHKAKLTQLDSDTRYYYQITHNGEPLNSDELTWFRTAPVMGKKKATRIWLVGDVGVAGETQSTVITAARTWLAENQRHNSELLDLMLTSGDNAYQDGQNKEYQKHFFTPFSQLIKQHNVWPAFGNHDATSDAYFDIFDFPSNGEIGGIPSQSKKYFSFNYSNIHFVFLDTETSSLELDSPMLTWLERDLEDNHQNWIIAVLHHPPYTRGSYNSDNLETNGGRLRQTRENVLPILEYGGADMVIAGHSHVYERSKLINCHYGTSDSLQNDMIRQAGSGYAFDKPYMKFSETGGANEGTVYMVLGSSATKSGGPLNHPVMAYSKKEYGSVVIDIDDLTLTSRFIDYQGHVSDEFTILKGEWEAISQNRECL